MTIMEHAGGDHGPGAAPEMESRPAIRSLTGSKSSAQSTQESNESLRNQLLQGQKPDAIET